MAYVYFYQKTRKNVNFGRSEAIIPFTGAFIIVLKGLEISLLSFDWSVFMTAIAIAIRSE